MLSDRLSTFWAPLTLVTLAALGAATPGSAQVPAGVVAALEGSVTATRASLPLPVPLARRDAVFLRDRIATRERSFAQLLLGGKALVTVREWSTLTVNEVPSTATVELGLGRLAIAVAKDKMRPGESVEIKTPNCVVGIRGTVVVAEVAKTAARGTIAGLFTTTITVLRGTVGVTQLDPQTGRPLGAPVTVGPLGRVELSGTAPLRSLTITPQAARELAGDFSVEKKNWPTIASPTMVQAHIDEALRQAAALAPSAGSVGAALTSAPPAATPLGSVSTTATSLITPLALPTTPGPIEPPTLEAAPSVLSRPIGGPPPQGLLPPSPSTIGGTPPPIVGPPPLGLLPPSPPPPIVPTPAPGPVPSGLPVTTVRPPLPPSPIPQISPKLLK